MTAHISATGRLISAPHRIERNEKSFVLSRLAVDLSHAGIGGDGTSFGLLAFGQAAHRLAECETGETVSVIGQLQVATGTDPKTGKPREGFQIVVASLMSARFGWIAESALRDQERSDWTRGAL
ncbi:MAG: hypothetical protein EPN45_09665 [Rhizobiaceae bacterium]|nr:MAG: hypothetical protein EPN45_09665 [Rhizobiaceae bacterium]